MPVAWLAGLYGLMFVGLLGVFFMLHVCSRRLSSHLLVQGLQDPISATSNWGPASYRKCKKQVFCSNWTNLSTTPGHSERNSDKSRSRWDLVQVNHFKRVNQAFEILCFASGIVSWKSPRSKRVWLASLCITWVMTARAMRVTRPPVNSARAWIARSFCTAESGENKHKFLPNPSLAHGYTSIRQKNILNSEYLIWSKVSLLWITMLWDCDELPSKVAQNCLAAWHSCMLAWGSCGLLPESTHHTQNSSYPSESSRSWWGAYCSLVLQVLTVHDNSNETVSSITTHRHSIKYKEIQEVNKSGWKWIVLRPLMAVLSLNQPWSLAKSNTITISLCQ